MKNKGTLVHSRSLRKRLEIRAEFVGSDIKPQTSVDKGLSKILKLTIIDKRRIV
ncbi:hypothetical protein SBDP2_1120003 [Syntrophobacter sp. SbD2]|nr:hypothetical protein SBDP2_1120003 [Syntrophobacter sp. SbD2]